MPSSEHQRLVFRDKFRSLFYEDFQSWIEELLQAIHPPGDFQAIRKTQGDGGLDGYVISSQLVYAVYAPARSKEYLDSQTAAKIRADFAKAFSTLSGYLKAWIFVHNHPVGCLGKHGIAAINDLRKQNPSVDITVLNIDSLWERPEFNRASILTFLYLELGKDSFEQCRELEFEKRYIAFIPSRYHEQRGTNKFKIISVRLC